MTGIGMPISQRRIPFFTLYTLSLPEDNADYGGVVPA
jgi:hypothetical protein